jgi:transposase-like protein
MEAVPYTDGFKQQMVRRMLGPSAVTARELSRKVGVSQPTLSAWLRGAHRVAAVKPPDEKKSEVLPPPKKWTAEEKLRVLVEAHGLEGTALGALLRKEGLHEAQLKEWREVAAGALSQSAETASSGPLTAGQRRRLAASERRVKELERELRRKEKALAETAALLVLEKKLEALGWDEPEAQGQEDDEANERRGK